MLMLQKKTLADSLNTANGTSYSTPYGQPGASRDSRYIRLIAMHLHVSLAPDLQVMSGCLTAYMYLPQSIHEPNPDPDEAPLRLASLPCQAGWLPNMRKLHGRIVAMKVIIRAPDRAMLLRSLSIETMCCESETRS